MPSAHLRSLGSRPLPRSALARLGAAGLPPPLLAALVAAHESGAVAEVRSGLWQRGPLDLPFDQVEEAYAAFRRWSEMTCHAELQLRFRLQPGDVVAFDNRRVLHARSEFTDAGGLRHLRGGYTERDELHSRIRILERGCRQRRVAQVRSMPAKG